MVSSLITPITYFKASIEAVEFQKFVKDLVEMRRILGLVIYYKSSDENILIVLDNKPEEERAKKSSSIVHSEQFAKSNRAE